MSVDKPTGGDGFPDRLSGEDRPFPGAPEDRGPAPELPKNTLSMEEVRAVHQRSSNNAEFEAAAEAHAKAQAADSSGSPGSGPPGPGSAGEGPAAVSGNGPDVPVGRHPEELSRAEGFTRPDSELPPIPGAIEDRGPAPELPKNTLSMEEVRALHQRSNSNAEFEAMAAEYAAAGNGGGSGPDRWRDRAMPDHVPGPAEDSDRDEQGSEDSGGRSRPDAAEQSRRTEGAAVQENAGERNDAQEQLAENQPEGRDQIAEPLRERPRLQEHEPEVRPDAAAEQTDEQRWAAMEQRMQSAMEQKLEAALDGIKADYEAKLDEHKAEHKAEVESIKTDYEAKISDLAARLEAVETDRRPEPDYRDHGDTGSEAGARDVVAPGRRGDRPAVGESDDDRAVLADASDIDEMRVPGSDREAPRVHDRSILSPEDAELAKSAAGVLGSLGVSIPGMDLLTGGDSTRKAIEKMPPEGQLRAMRMAEDFGILSSSMPPETAAVAFAASLLGPGLYAKSRDSVRDFVQKIRPKE